MEPVKKFRLGNYTLLKQLGAGGMGVVYLAEHVHMKRRVAIKVLPSRLVKDKAYLERFHREAQSIAALDHPNIVHAYDVDNEGAIHYLVMEYVEGKELEQIVTRHGPLSPERAAGLIRQAANGLAHAHARGLVHRDIKPSNLLVDKTETLRILDLGLARAVATGEADGTAEQEENVVGTTDYLAPEQALGAKDIDGRADIYSLGCTLYYLLTGSPPFPGESLAERLVKHQMETPPSIANLRPDVPEELIAICSRMLEKKPTDRYSAQELSEVLSDLYPPSPSERSGGSSTTIRKAGLPSPEDSALNFDLPVEGSRAGRSSVIRNTRDRNLPTNLLWAGGGGAALLLLFGGWLILATTKKPASARLERPASRIEKPSVREVPATPAPRGRSFALKDERGKSIWPGADAPQPQEPANPQAAAQPAVPAVVDLSRNQSVFSRVEEARDYTLVYQLRLPDEARFNGRTVPYSVDNRAEIRQPFDRVAWCLELGAKEGEVPYAYVSCDAWSQDLELLGVPATDAKFRLQMELKNLNIFSNVPGLETGAGRRGGIEFWETNYGQPNAAHVPGAADDKYDFGDQMSGGGGYGSMQVHNWDAKQTIFAYNNWGGGAGEAGLGNQATGNSDWTFTNNIRSYATRELYVLVRCKTP